MPQSLVDMAALIKQFAALRLRDRELRLGHMRSFLETADQHLRQYALLRPPAFNLFSVFGIQADEVIHSAFLAWLFDAQAGHGQGKAFLEGFLSACQLDRSVELPDSYRVQTEFPGCESIVDVLVFRVGVFLIYLENKIHAAEGEDQIDREFRDMRRYGRALHVPETRQYAVFLTPDGRGPTSGDPSGWISVSYGSVAAQWQKLLPQIQHEKLRAPLQDWIETIGHF